MERKHFLRGIGLAGLGSFLPLNKTKAAMHKLTKATLLNGGCILIPSETEGPFGLDLSNDSTMFRQVINETKTGLQLNLTLSIVNINDNCNPIANARVDVWHCDKDGVYSGVNQPGANTIGQTFCRGIQMSDSNGLVQFTTVYPGWYPGRITHIHFQVFLNSVLSATSQLAFPDSVNVDVYNTSLYANKGQNTTVANNASDGVFSSPAGDLQYEIVTINPNSVTGGYDATLTVGIDAPLTGIINLEPETGGQFKLKQNYPNPFSTETIIPFTLNYAANVKIEIYDLMGKKVIDLLNKKHGCRRTQSSIEPEDGQHYFTYRELCLPDHH